MQSSYASLPDIVIAAGQTNSNVFNGVYVYHDATQLILYGTGAYGAETYKIQVNQDQEATNSSSGWVDLQIAGADVTPPAASKSKEFGVDLVSSGSFRIVASAGVAAERRWKANKLWSWGG